MVFRGSPDSHPTQGADAQSCHDCVPYRLLSGASGGARRVPCSVYSWGWWVLLLSEPGKSAAPTCSMNQSCDQACEL